MKISEEEMKKRIEEFQELAKEVFADQDEVTLDDISGFMEFYFNT